MTKQELLFILPPREPETDPKLKWKSRKIWSSCKARLIHRYLFYFVQITKHGTYLDGFAGPQDERGDEESRDQWSANLVLDLKLLRNHYLFEKSDEQYERLRSLVRTKHPDIRQKVRLYHGDVNHELPKFLRKRRIKNKEAAFCLLDQRTFECEWSTVEEVARYKSGGRKIEIFYFLANHWMSRSLAALKDDEVGTKWFGSPDWKRLKDLKRGGRLELFLQKFRDLGYASVKPWAIYDARGSSRIMYHMIHATDHPEAPKLMARAYDWAVEPLEDPEQFLLELDAAVPQFEQGGLEEGCDG